MNIGMLSGKGKDVPECVYEFAFPTANSYMRPGNKPLFRGRLRIIIPVRGRKPFESDEELKAAVEEIKNHNPRKGTETILP